MDKDIADEAKAKEMARWLGSRGGKARAAGMDQATRSALARLASARRWSGTTKAQRMEATAAARTARKATARARRKKGR